MPFTTTAEIWERRMCMLAPDPTCYAAAELGFTVGMYFFIIMLERVEL